MATKEDVKSNSPYVKAVKIEDSKPVLDILAAAVKSMPQEDRSQSALDLRTGTSRKRPHSTDDEKEGSTPTKLIKRKPTDQELALNLFIKQLAVEWLDRRLTIVQQPRHRLAQLEGACQRQFPTFSERQIRLKIRGQLKLYRRNLKKAEERKLSKSGVSCNARPTPIEWSPLNSIEHQPTSSYLACNPNALSLARRALSNERKQGTRISETKADLMPLKVLSDWQNIGIAGLRPGINKTLPLIRPNACVSNAIPFPRLAPTNLLMPPIRAQPNPLMMITTTTAANSSSTETTPTDNGISLLKAIQTNNSALTTTPNDTYVCKVANIDVVKIMDPNVSMAGSFSLNSPPPKNSVNSKTPSKLLAPPLNSSNRSWVSTPISSSFSPVAAPFYTQPVDINGEMPADPPSTMIANCLRLAANFLLQSASFFESKNDPLTALNNPLLPPHISAQSQPPRSQSIDMTNPTLFGGLVSPFVQPPDRTTSVVTATEADETGLHAITTNSPPAFSKT